MNHIDNDTPDIDIIIARYFSGNASPDEVDSLRTWIEQSPENRKSFFELQDLWEVLNPSFDVTDSDTEKAERRVLTKTGITPHNSGIIRKLFVFWSRIAAVAILPLLAIAIYVLVRPDDADVRNISLSTDYGCSSKATLPDGTVVWLNANSNLEYSRNMGDCCRDVDLRGEAYFDVHADADHPFNVHTPYITVTATGTEFNVNAYDHNASVTLTEGSVEVSDAVRKVSMMPGEHLSLRDGRMDISKDVDTDRYCAWRDGILVFEDEPILSICRRLQQIYNVEFDVDPRLTDRTFRFILKGESIRDVMELFQMTAPVKCITGNNGSSTDSINSHQIIRIIPL